ncbi:hypothetical protein FOZ63_019296, partial [Perkinsus olseni]
VSNLVFAVEEDPALVSAFNWEDKLIAIDDQVEAAPDSVVPRMLRSPTMETLRRAGGPRMSIHWAMNCELVGCSPRD